MHGAAVPREWTELYALQDWGPAEKTLSQSLQKVQSRVHDALCDNFNTSAAIDAVRLECFAALTRHAATPPHPAPLRHATRPIHPEPSLSALLVRALRCAYCREGICLCWQLVEIVTETNKYLTAVAAAPQALLVKKARHARSPLSVPAECALFSQNESLPTLSSTIPCMRATPSACTVRCACDGTRRLRCT